MSLITKQRREEPPQPQLTALIDVCSLLIIFLIAGTVFGGSTIFLPGNLALPLSQRAGDLGSAPQISVTASEISLESPSLKIPTEKLLASTSAEGTEVSSFRAALRKLRGPSSVIHFVGDKNLSYREVYDVSRVLREEGFEAIVYVSQHGKP